MCSDNIGAGGEPDGECPDCGADTIDGIAKDICPWSASSCYTCGYAECELRC